MGCVGKIIVFILVRTLYIVNGMHKRLLYGVFGLGHVLLVALKLAVLGRVLLSPWKLKVLGTQTTLDKEIP